MSRTFHFSGSSLKFERQRLLTFTKDKSWSLSFISPHELASNGFWFLGDLDRCCCVFCDVIIQKWEIGDIPSKEHARHSPHCPFIRGEPVGNVPMALDKTFDKLKLSTKYYSCSLTAIMKYLDKSTSNGCIGGNGIMEYSNPKIAKMISKEDRLRSFYSCRWMKKTPEELAEAGFFSTFLKLYDQVRCFYCGVCLEHWENNSDPWVQHARWYPECNFIKIMKGQKFINNVAIIPESDNLTELMDGIDTLMNLDIARAVRDMGYKLIHIKRAFIRELWHTGGSPFFNLKRCIECVIKEMENESTTLSHIGGISDHDVVTNDAITMNFTVVDNMSNEGNKRKIFQCETCCNELPREIVFLPCQHMGSYSPCIVKSMKLCPICQVEIKYTVNPIFDHIKALYVLLVEIIMGRKFSNYDSLKFERERLHTFIDWPIDFVSPEELAANGFFFLRYEDICVCAFCHEKVGKWEVGDTPRREHARHCPHCPFVQGKNVGNIPMAAAASSETTSTEIDFLQELVNNNNNNNNIDDGVTPIARMPNMSTKESRLKSFNDLQWQIQIRQTPSKLADAGFLSCNVSDHVICFYCGKGLRNWKSHHDPWIQHARSYPGCYYVKRMKGQEFIENAKKNNNNNNNTEDGDSVKLDVLLNLDIMQIIHNMGYDMNIIKEVFRQHFQNNNNNNTIITCLPVVDFKSCLESVVREVRRIKEEEEEEEEEEEGCDSDTLTSSSPSLPIHEVKEEEDYFPTELISHNVIVSSKQEEKRQCQICMDAPMAILFLPCRHMVSCPECTLRMTSCPICRTEIKYIIRPILV